MSIPAAYLSVILIWSTTPLAIQWSGVMDSGVFFSLGPRLVVGAVLSLGLLWLLGQRMVWTRAALLTYVAMNFMLVVGMPLVYWGARYVPSGQISVIFGLTPLFTSMFAAMWLAERSLTPGKILGIFLGLAGLGLIFRAELGVSNQGLQGLVAVFAGMLAHAASMVGVKRIGADLPPLAATTGALLLSLPVLLVFWAIAGPAPPPEIPPRTVAAILYLSVFGSVFGLLFYFYLLKHLETGKVALITLVTPVMALVLGQALNGEHPSLLVWAGGLTVLLGLATHLWGDRVLMPVWVGAKN